MRYIRFIQALLPLVAVACMAENTEPAAPAMVQPGTVTRELGAMQFGDSTALSSSLTEGERTELTPCYMARDAGTIVIVEFMAEPQIVEAGASCDGPYAGTYLIYTVQTLGVVAGPALPVQYELVVTPAWLVGGRYNPKPGDVWLITSREAEGEQFFAAPHAPINFDQDGTVQTLGGGDFPPADLPPTFEGLVEMFTPLVSDLATHCPEDAAKRRSDETWRYIHFDPASRNCHIDDPADNVEPE